MAFRRLMLICLFLVGGIAAFAERVPERHGPATRLAVHVGNNPADLVHFERWLGCPVTGVSIHTGQANWDDWSGSIGFQLGRWKATPRTLYWSIPLIPEGASLADAAAGRFDQRYTGAAREISAATPGNDRIDVRTGWEFNTRYMPWASHGHEAEFIGAYERFVAAFRAVSPRFRFEWTPNIGGTDDPGLSYPGDGSVDVIGIDSYYDLRWNSPNAEFAWTYTLDRPFGFQWFEEFAAAHGKPTAYAEWGVNSPDAQNYISHFASWVSTHHPLYQSYWNSNSSFKGKLDDGAMPRVGKAYKAEFGTCSQNA